MATNVVMEVDRAAHGATRVVEAEMGPLGAGRIRLRIDRFAVTANNITYAGIGDMLGYWDFFPSGADGWGRVPAMGWAEVVESGVEGIDVGGRYYGWFPMAAYVDLTATPTSDGLRDDGDHRAAHAPVYRRYTEADRDPMMTGADAGSIVDVEERHALLRGLFVTGFLIDEFVASLDGGAPEQVVVLSASSKTGIALAHQTSLRSGVRVVGLTSAGNAGFVRSLGCYDEVLSYDEVASLPVVPSAVVDMAGAAEVVAAVHARLGDEIRSSLIIGRSHHDAAPAEVVDGPAPEFFFAPTEVERRLADWGPDGYRDRVASGLAVFVDASRSWMTVDRRNGADDAEATWRDVHGGAVPPSVGRIVSLHEERDLAELDGHPRSPT